MSTNTQAHNIAMTGRDLLRAAIDDETEKTMVLATKHGIFDNLCDMAVLDDSGARKSVMRMCHEYALECLQSEAGDDKAEEHRLRKSGRLHERTRVILDNYVQRYAAQHLSRAKDDKSASFTLKADAINHLRTALHFSTDFNHYDHCRALCRLVGFNVNAKDPNTGQTALHRAAQHGLVETVNMLLSFKKTLFKTEDNAQQTAEQLARARCGASKIDGSCCELCASFKRRNENFARGRRKQRGMAKGLAMKREYLSRGHQPTTSNRNTVALRAYYRNHRRVRAKYTKR